MYFYGFVRTATLKFKKMVRLLYSELRKRQKQGETLF